MGKMNVAQFAGELGLPVGLLLEQLQAAGVAKQQESDSISEQDKAQLLEHLHSAHGNGSEKNKKITLTRRETTEIKKADSTGRARTIQVEVRKKRVVAPITAAQVEQPAAAVVVKVTPVQAVSKTSKAEILGEQAPLGKPRSAGNHNQPICTFFIDTRQLNQFIHGQISKLFLRANPLACQGARGLLVHTFKFD